MGDLSYERFPRNDFDPRSGLDEAALEEASKNAFPIVARDARKRDKAGLMMGGAIALILGALTFASLAGRTGVEAPVMKPAVPAAAPATATPKPETKQQVPAQTAVALPPLTPAQTSVLARPPGQAAIFQLPASSPVMVYDTSADLGVAVRTAPNTPASQIATAAGGLNENEAFGSRLGSTGVDTASATRLADPTNTITQGTLIPAILETAIDSDLPGYVRAVVSLDVRSFDGKQVLVPRSSRLIGQYKSGLAAGQTRAYVIWTRLIRPDGVSVALASPAVEYSGRSGLSGEVDNHFFKRFGSASLLSVIGGLGAIASGGTAGLLIASGGQSAASVAAQRDAQIPPTIRVAQGQPVRVFTARDLDFSGIGQ